jgi:5-methylcytosine-specific restriction protein A
MATKAARLKAKNHHAAEAARRSAAQRGYDRKWSRFRLSFLAANPLCVKCKQAGFTVPATQVDHIVPHRGDMRLFWRTSNLQPLCHSCHSKKTASGQ